MERLKRFDRVPFMDKQPTHITLKPIILDRYPGWEIRIVSVDGKISYYAYDTNPGSVAIGPSEDTFTDALYFVRHGEPPIMQSGSEG